MRRLAAELLFVCALLIGGIVAWCVAAVAAPFIRNQERIRKEDV